MRTLPRSNPAELPAKARSPLWIRIGFCVCVAIGAGAVIRRLFALANPAHNGPAQMSGLDEAFAAHAALTLAHIVPAISFVLLAPFAVFSRFARLRWPQRILFPLGALVGITAYGMTAYAIGGWTERSAIYLFNTLFLYSLARSFLFRQRGEPARARRWLLRAVAILLGIGTARPVMAIFFATSPVTHLAPSQFFGIAMWAGFTINLLVFEAWVRSGDRHSSDQREPAIRNTDRPAHGSI